MKRFLALFFTLLFALSLCACQLDFSDQLNDMSNSIFDQIVEGAGGILKEDTSSNDYDFDHELQEPDDTDTSTGTITDTDTGTDTSTDTTTDTDSDIVDPEPEPEPEPDEPGLTVYERVKYPINKFVGLNVTTDNHKIKGLYGAARLYRTLDTCLEDPVGFAHFTINGYNFVTHIDLDLSRVGAQENGLSVRQVASKLNSFAATYSISSVYNARYIELGSSPDKTISAQDYASLLNYCYDGKMGELGEGFGIVEVDSSIKIIAGQLSNIDFTTIAYVNNLMKAIQAERGDGFLPIGGWSFRAMPNGTPEQSYLNDLAMSSLLNYREKTYPNMEIHISGFGYDTVDTTSPYYAAPKGEYSSEEMQGAYILRTFMILDALGIDRATLDILNDTESAHHGIINTDGTKKAAYGMLESFNTLTTKKPKTTRYYMSFKEAIVNGENGVYVYRYENELGESLYAVWSTDGVESYSFDSLSGAVKVAAYDNDANKYSVPSEAQTLDGAGINVSVSDIPTFVLVENVQE